MNYLKVIIGLAILNIANLSYADSLGQFLDDIKVTVVEAPSSEHVRLDQVITTTTISDKAQLKEFFNAGSETDVACKKSVLKFIVQRARTLDASPSLVTTIDRRNAARPGSNIVLEVKLYKAGSSDRLVPILYTSISPLDLPLFAMRPSTMDPENKDLVSIADSQKYDAAFAETRRLQRNNSCGTLDILRSSYEQYSHPLYNNRFGSPNFAESLEDILGDNSAENSQPPVEPTGPVMN